MRVRIIAAIISVSLLALVSGCGSPAATTSATNAASLPDVASDYPGWTVKSRVGPTTTQIVAGPDAQSTRDDVSFALVSPEGDIRILAWYARSSTHGESTGWFNPDELYSSGQDLARPQSLHRWMLDNRAEEQLLGAYPENEGASKQLEIWHVGFYNQTGTSWVRGDHLLSYDPETDEWSLTEEDSGSDNSWNVAGAVRVTR